jgi:hypothetical protein
MASQFWQYCSSNFGAMFVLFVSAVLGSGANWLSLFRPVAIHNLHSLNGVFRPVPYGERSWSGTRFSFRANRNIVTKHGHDWCTITKNNWMCFGKRKHSHDVEAGAIILFRLLFVLPTDQAYSPPDPDPNPEALLLTRGAFVDLAYNLEAEVV